MRCLVSTRGLLVTLLGAQLAAAGAGCGDSASSADLADVGPRDAAVERAPDVAVERLPPPDAPPPFFGTINGRVEDPSGAAIADAIVRFGGRDTSVTSAADGRFSIDVPESDPVQLDQIALTAGKPQYFSAGVAVADPSAEQRIVLTPLTQTDNADYDYKKPGSLTNPIDPTPDCRHCHENQLRPFEGSAHAGAASNPRLHDIYNGTASGISTEADCTARGGRWLEGKALGAAITVAKKCYVALGGVLSHLNSGCGGSGQPSCDDPRLSTSLTAGPCADCHAAASKGHVAGNTDLNKLDALTHEKGIHCDFCHKIARVDVNDRPGLDGALVLLRPSNKQRPGGWSENEVMFGPLSDVTAVTMGNVYQPQFAKAEFCSACHQWLSKGIRPQDQSAIDASKWPNGLPLQDTYYEWSQSSKAGVVHCQKCHMPAKPYETATQDLMGAKPWTSNVLGWPRAFGQVHEHSFAPRLPPLGSGEKLGPGEPPRDLLRAPLSVNVTTQRQGGTLSVSVTLENVGAGHSLPTGTPSRQLLLLVSAEAGGTPLRASAGYSVPSWVGSYLVSELASGKASLVGDKLTLPAGQGWPAAASNLVVRFVARSAAFADYPATRWFAGKSAQQKGMPIDEPRAVARVLSVNGQTATLDHAPSVAAGARVIVADALPDLSSRKVDDSFAVRALGGAAGWAFGKLMRASDGRVGVPFFMASDIASDNRIPAGAEVTTQHAFDASGAAGQPIELRVVLLYRKYPWDRSRERGWSSNDAVRYISQRTVAP